MSPYRDASELPVVIVPQGLVRANGSRCRCRPPGLLWCWWFEVQRNDRWFCIHGGGWRREYNAGAVVVSLYWDALPPSSNDQETKHG